MITRQVLQLPTMSPGKEQMTDVLTDNSFSPGTFFVLSLPVKEQKNEVGEKKKTLKNDFSLHHHWHKVTYVMARSLTLTKKVCPHQIQGRFKLYSIASHCILIIPGI